MATYYHPITGVLLNDISVFRKSLDGVETETARLLRRDGFKVQDIASMLGTNQGRVAEALGLKRKRRHDDDEDGEPMLF